MTKERTGIDRFRPLEARQFVAGIRRITIAALIIVPSSGIMIMTFLGVYPWPDLLNVLVQYSGVVIAINVFLILMLSKHLSRKIVTIVENDKSVSRDKDLQTLLKRVPLLFFGILSLYTLQGAVSANLSLEHFQGYQFDVKYYAYTFYGTIPTLLISSFPIYFYLVDYMGRYLAPRGIQVRIAPLSAKLAILGLFTPVLIDTVLLLYYYDRTHFLTIETISLWFGLLIIAGVGSRLAWNSMQQSLYPLEQFVEQMERGNTLAGEGPVPRSLDELGAVSHRMATLTNERHKIESDLLHERKFVNAVFENAGALILVMDKQGRICRFNRACEKLSGYRFEEVRDGYAWDYFLDPKDVEQVRVNAFDALANHPERLEGQYTNNWVSRDGNKRMIDWRNSVLLDANGDMEYMISIGTDITEKTQNERALVESYQMQRSLLKLAQQLEAARSNEDLYVLLEEELRQVLGYSRAWLYLVDDDPRFWNLVLRPGENPAETDVNADSLRLDLEADPFLAALARCRHIDVVEDMRLNSLANQKMVEASGLRTAVHVPLVVSGRLYGFIGMGTFGAEGIRVLRDSELNYLDSVGTLVVGICERIRFEVELARYRDHLEELVESRTRELKEAQSELVRRERLSTLGQLTATVSHELRNPLGSMRSSTFILKQKIQQDDQIVLRAVDRIERGIERCDHIIDELLDFTRITSLEKASRSLDQWVASIVKEHALPAGIGIETSFGLDSLHGEFDPHRFRRALVNVMDNAVQAMIPNGAETPIAGAMLHVSTCVRNSRIEVVVQDNGSGISPEVLPRIFEPLFSTKNFGVGLGMPAVKQIMQQHGGGIEIASEPGKGTTITLWLPMRGSDSSPAAESVAH